MEGKIILINDKLEPKADNLNPLIQRGSDTVNADTLRIKRQLQPVTVKLGIIVLRVTINSPEKAILAKAMAWVAKPQPIATGNRIKLPNDKESGLFPPEGSFANSGEKRALTFEENRGTIEPKTV